MATPDDTTDAAGQDCGGESLYPKPGGGVWQCSFDDEFDAATGDANSLNTSEWTPQLTADSGFYDGPSDAQECFVDNPDTINVSGGALHLTVLQTAQPFDCGGMFTTTYEGGEVMTDNSFDQTYGRFEVRAQLPQTAVQGLQETFWLWPQTYQSGTWPGSGEIDLAEFYSLDENLDIPFLHYDYDSSTVNSSSSTNIDTRDCQIDSTQYNDYAVVWEPGQITISINGQTCMTDNYIASGGAPDAPFNSPFFLNLTQALGIGNNAFLPGTTPLPATTSIQYVRVWS